MLISEINVAAFAAIMVVLFALFALPEMWPLFDPERGGSADLPHVSHSRPMKGANRTDAIWLTVQRTGDVWVGHKKIVPEKLPAEIQERLRRGAEKKIYINADARAKYGRVREALAGIQAAGVENVAFLVWEVAPDVAHPIAQSGRSPSTKH